MRDGQRLAVFIQVIGIVGKPLSGSIGRSPDRQLARRHQATGRGLRAIQIPRLQVGVQPGEDPFESHVAAGRVANEGTVLRLVGRQVGVIGKSGAEKPRGWSSASWYCSTGLFSRGSWMAVISASATVATAGRA